AHPPLPGGVPPIMPPSPDVFHTVVSGENTWKIIEAKLNTLHAMNGLVPGADTHMIDTLKDQLEILPASALRNLGWASGNINLIQPGNVLDMSGIINTHTILDAFSNANSLSPAQ